MRKTTKIIEKKIRQCHILTLKSYFTCFHFLKVSFFFEIEMRALNPKPDFLD